MAIATVKEVQNNFDRSLKVVQEGVLPQSGVEVVQLISKEQTMSFLSDCLVGVLSADVDEKAARAERIDYHEDPR